MIFRITLTFLSQDASVFFQSSCYMISVSSYIVLLNNVNSVFLIYYMQSPNGTSQSRIGHAECKQALLYLVVGEASLFEFFERVYESQEDDAHK